MSGALDWQTEYLSELRRTHGLDATFEKRTGPWWTLRIEGHSSPRIVQRRQVESFTKNLRGAPPQTA